MPADDPRTTVTVLIPVLNERRHLCQAVRSLQDQDFPGPVEFVFIDGGSSDGTRDLLASMGVAGFAVGAGAGLLTAASLWIWPSEDRRTARVRVVPEAAERQLGMSLQGRW